MTDQFLPTTNPTVKSFTQRKAAFAFVDKVVTAIALYILLVLIPSYEVLRYLWNPEYNLFSWQRIATGAVATTLFVLFARRTMRQYLSVS